MTEHRFHVGDLVRAHPTISVGTAEAFVQARAVRGLPDLFEVTRVLPELMDGEPQYRIRCIGQPERVVRESELILIVSKSDLRH